MRRINALGVASLVVIGGFLGLIGGITQNASASTWGITSVDSIGDQGRYSSLALDGSARPHISYYDASDHDLKYAKWNGVAWDIEVVDSFGLVGKHTSIALDSKGYPHISYFDNINLQYAYWKGTSWGVQTADPAGGTGEYTSIAVDENDYSSISYYDASNGDLKYAKWNGSVWINEIVDSSGTVGMYTSVDLDRNGDPHIGYYDASNGDLKYAKWNGTSWSTETVDSTDDVGRFASLELDANDNAHIGYQDNTRGDLKYAKWTGSEWSIEKIDGANVVGSFASLALDIDGYPHISYHYGTGMSLKYARWNGLSWNKETVDSLGWIGRYTSIAVDNYGYPHISYYEYINTNLRYARVTPTIPFKTRNLQAVAGDGQVTLTWEAPMSEGGSPIANYIIHRGTAPDGEVYLTKVGNVLNYVDNQVTNGRTYYYMVNARNSYDDGPVSNEANSTPLGLPSDPQFLHVSSSDEQVKLVWNAPSSDGGSLITNYRIYRSTSSGGGTFLTELGNAFTYEDTSCINGLTYYYQVSALNAVGEGPFSNEESATPAGSPSRPENLQAIPGDGQVTLEWAVPISDGGSPITSYILYRGVTSGGESFLADIGNVLTYTDTGLANGLTYYYQVGAVKAIGEGDLSTEVTVTPGTSPTTPRDLTVMPGNSYVYISWKLPVQNGGFPVKNFRIYRDTTPGGEALLIELGDESSYNDTAVTNEITYYYQISAVNARGEGPLSPEVGGTPLNHPPTCTLLSPPPGSTIYGSHTISGEARDSDGTVQVVEIRIDDGVWMQVVGTTSWVYDWDTKGVSDGQHTIHARSFDGEHNSTEMTVMVEVNNPSEEKAIFEEFWFWLLIVMLIVIVGLTIALLRIKELDQEATPERTESEEPEKEVPE